MSKTYRKQGGDQWECPGRKFSRQRDSQCNGPRVRNHVGCLKNSKETSAVGVKLENSKNEGLSGRSAESCRTLQGIISPLAFTLSETGSHGRIFHEE